MSGKWIGAGLLACTIAASALVLEPPSQHIDAAARDGAIAGLAAALRTRHADPALGAQAAARIENAARRGAYAALSSRDALAAALNSEQPAQAALVVEEAAAALWSRRGALRTDSYQPDIGYLAIPRFEPAALAAPAYAQALHDLRHVRSVIIDLRGNAGGDASAMRILASHFVDRRLRLSDVRSRTGQEPAQDWTGPPPARAHLGQLIMLVDRATAAEAEEFVHAMQRLKRGRVFGEPTAGIAYRRQVHAIGAGLVARIPATIPSAPDSLANWHGSGIRPDVATAPGDALRLARVAILQDRLDHATTPMARIELRKMIDHLQEQQ